MYAVGVGPPPCRIRDLTTEVLAKALQTLKQPRVLDKAQEISQSMGQEDGVEMATRAFYKHLPVNDMVCDVCLLLPPGISITSHVCNKQAQAQLQDLEGHHRQQDLLIAEVYHTYTGLKVSQEVHAVMREKGSIFFHSEYAYVDWDMGQEAGLIGSVNAMFSAAGFLVHETVMGAVAVVEAPLTEVHSVLRRRPATTLSRMCAMAMAAYLIGLVRGILGVVVRPLYGVIKFTVNLLLALGGILLAPVAFCIDRCTAAVSTHPPRKHARLGVTKNTFVRRNLLFPHRGGVDVEAMDPATKRAILSTYPVSQRVKWEWNLLDGSRRCALRVFQIDILLGRLVVRPPFHFDSDEFSVCDLLSQSAFMCAFVSETCSRFLRDGSPRDPALAEVWRRARVYIMTRLRDVYSAVQGPDGGPARRGAELGVAPDDEVSFVGFCRAYRDAYFNGFLDVRVPHTAQVQVQALERPGPPGAVGALHRKAHQKQEHTDSLDSSSLQNNELTQAGRGRGVLDADDEAGGGASSSTLRSRSRRRKWASREEEEGGDSDRGGASAAVANGGGFQHTAAEPLLLAADAV